MDDCNLIRTSWQDWFVSSQRFCSVWMEASFTGMVSGSFPDGIAAPNLDVLKMKTPDVHRIDLKGMMRGQGHNMSECLRPEEYIYIYIFYLLQRRTGYKVQRVGHRKISTDYIEDRP